jgi:vanillate O-demethylase ferredoxin subunit
MTDELLQEVRVVALREEAAGVISCELRAQNEALPACPPGAHVDVHLPNGLVRQYSVAQADARRYVIAVKRESASRGGSAYVADALRIGTTLRIGAPRDAFPLVASDARVVLIAGGIGITALLPMARRLQADGRDWSLHYAVRRPEQAAFADSLRDLGDRARIHASAETGTRLSISELVAGQPTGTHFYCCGPASMLEAFGSATASLPTEQVHLERFTAAAPQGGEQFTVWLARSSRSIAVAPDQTIVDALAGAGVEVPHSCLQGICGSCEARVIEGIPDHRDEVLTESERASNATMILCCSRAKTAELVLDL